MSVSALPTRIRQNIRDHITIETCPLVLKTKAVTATLGYPIRFDPEWIMLWKSLQEFYPDQSTFVPTIATTIITWCDAFTTWLETDENEEQVERMLDGLKARSGLTLVLEISPSSKRPTTAWRANNSVFIIALPKWNPPHRSSMLAGFSTDFLNLFQASPILSAAKLSINDTPVLEDPDGWADLEEESHSHGQAKLHLIVKEDVGGPIPEISTLPRPEELTKRPPYWLVVKQEGLGKVVVQGSHTASLTCLEEYLKRWRRGAADRANRPPVVEVKLQESSFGLGVMNDTLVLEAIRGREVSAMLILVFVESVLGYTPVESSRSAGYIWEFRRTKGFQ